jgi:hypothetical protein
MLQPQSGTEAPELIWLDGEALCVSPAFQTCLNGSVPDWLNLGSNLLDPRQGLQRQLVTLPDGRRALLVRRRSSRPLHWLQSWLRGRPLVAPEVKQAGTIFRLQRCGIDTPRLLAFGQRLTRPWATDSLMLTEPLDGLVPVGDWLRNASGPAKWHGLRRLADWLRELHEVGCYVARGAEAVSLRPGPDGHLTPALGDVAAVRARRRPNVARAWADLRRLSEGVPADLLSGTDRLRFVLRYLGADRLTPQLCADLRGRFPRRGRRVAHA